MGDEKRIVVSVKVHYLWVQERVAAKDMKLSKVWGHDNPADLLTKVLGVGAVVHRLNLMNLKFEKAQ